MIATRAGREAPRAQNSAYDFLKLSAENDRDREYSLPVPVVLLPIQMYIPGNAALYL